MKKLNRSGILILSLFLGLFSWIGPANADLLDEEEEAPVVTPKIEPIGPQIKPLKPAKSSDDEDDEEEESSGSGSGKKSGPRKPAAKAPGKSRPTAPGVKNNKDDVGAPREPVHFESKGLRGLKDKGTVELIEEVVITQGELRLEADRAKIFYDDGQKEVARVLAEGNVKIFNVERSTGEKMKAFSNQVEFLNKNRTVIMEGNARLWRGTQSVIRGKKITYEIDSGWIKGDRVAGELQPEDNKTGDLKGKKK